MNVNRFSVRVIGGDEQDNGYVKLRHGQTYKLSLHNYRDDPCDAEVSIDGKVVGKWRIQARNNILLERPSDEAMLYTFYEAGTPEANSIGLVKGNSNLGLISVKFMPGSVVMPLKPQRVVEHHHHYHERWVNPWRWVDPYYPYYPPYQPSWTITCGGGNSSASYQSSNLSLEDNPIQTNYCASSISGVTAGGTGLSGRSNQYFNTIASLSYFPDQEVTINLRLVCDKQNIKPLKAFATRVPPPLC